MTDWMAFALEVTAKGTVVMLLACGVVLAGRGRSAAFRHWVWTLAMSAMLVLPMIVMLAPGWRVLPRWRAEAVRVERAQTVAVAAPVVPELVPLVSNELARTYVPRVAAPVVVKEEISWATWMGVAWGGIAILMLLPMAGAALYLRAMERRAIVLVGGEWGLLIERARRVLGIRRRAVLLQSARTKMPMTFGMVRPRIVLPAEAGDWDDAKRQMVLMHELAHVKRWDVLTQGLSRVVRAMYWFHPLVWVACRRMEIERERACDDQVITSGTGAATYAEALVEIATSLQGRRTLIGGIAMARQSTLETRVRAVLDGGCNRRRVPVTGALATVLGLLAVVVPLGILRGSDGVVLSGTGALTKVTEKSNAGVKLAGGGSVELTGISNAPDMGPWWQADGSPVAPQLENAGVESAPRQVGGLMFVFKFSGLAEGYSAPMYEIEGRPSEVEGGRGNMLRVIPMKAEDTAVRYVVGNVHRSKRAMRVSVSLGIAEGAWKTVMDGKPGESGKMSEGQFVIGEVLPLHVQGGMAAIAEGNPRGEALSQGIAVKVTHSFDLSNRAWRIVAMDLEGKPHAGNSRMQGSAGNLQMDLAEFEDIGAEKVKSFRMEVRSIEWVEFKDLPAEPGAQIVGSGSTVDNMLPAEPDRRGAGQILHTAAGDLKVNTSTTDNGKIMDMAAANLRALKFDVATTHTTNKSGEYYVMGDVQRAGVYMVSAQGLSPLQAIAAAGVGKTDDPLTMVKVTRIVDSKQATVLNERLSDLLRITSDVVVQGGDVIWVGVDEELKEHLINELHDESKQLQAKLAELYAQHKNVKDPDVVTIASRLEEVEGQLKQLTKKSY